jgi:membrane protease YdiL (CAAX protease family)
LTVAEESLATDPTLAAAVQGLALVAVTIGLAPRLVALARRLFPGRNVVFVRWGFSHVALVIGAVLLTGLACSLFPFARAEEPTLLSAISIQALSFGGGVLCVAYCAVQMAPEGLRSLGMPRGRHGRAVVTGIVMYALTLPAIYGVGLAWPYVLERLGADPEPQEWLSRFAEAQGSAFVAAAVLAVVIVPLLEELLFRVFLQPLLTQNFGEKGGIVLTAFVFAWMHGQDAFLPIFALSLVLGGLMLRTQRLSCVFGVHALHNGLTLVLAFALGTDGVAAGVSGLGLASVFFPG